MVDVIKIDMGWLFGGKKVPKVPLPQRYSADEATLRFPTSPASPQQRVIRPEEVKEAAGLDFGEMPFPSEDYVNLFQRDLATKAAVSSSSQQLTTKPATDSLYIKMDVYQRLLGEMDELRRDLGSLNELNRQLESSEYNEENNFEKLKRSVKSIHDKMLQVDKVLFKSRGD